MQHQAELPQTIAQLPHPSADHRQSDHYWTVDVIDGEGVVKQVQMKGEDIWIMPIVQRIVLQFNQCYQPIGEASGILSCFLEQVASDVKWFPSSYANWKRIPRTVKEKCYRNVIQEKFHFPDVVGKKLILGCLAMHWEDNRSYLFKEFYKPEGNWEENVLAHPSWTPQEQWAVFLDCGFNLEILENSESEEGSSQFVVEQDSLAEMRFQAQSTLGELAG